MDTLYGVTMQEKGISYILELELKDVIENFEEVVELVGKNFIIS